MCSIQTIAMPRAAHLPDRRDELARPRRRSGRRRSRRGAARPGSVASARASSSRLRSSRPRLSARRLASCVSPHELEHLDAARVGARCAAARRRCARRRARSRTPSCRRTAAASGAPGRCRAGSGARRRRVSRPRRGTARVPAVGRSDPARTFSSVVLPAPLGPTMPTASPAPTAKSTPSSTTSAPKRWRIPVAARSGADSDPTMIRAYALYGFSLAAIGTLWSSEFSQMTTGA